MYTLKTSNFWYTNKSLQKHLNWVLFTSYNLSSIELNTLRLKLKLHFNNKIINLKNKLLIKRTLNFNIFNKTIGITSNKKNMYFFRTYLFTLLTILNKTNKSMIYLLGYFSNYNYITWVTMKSCFRLNVISIYKNFYNMLQLKFNFKINTYILFYKFNYILFLNYMLLYNLFNLYLHLIYTIYIF